MNPDPTHIHKAAYDQIAPDFAARNAAMPASIVDEALRLFELIPIDGRVLDLGCGAGRDLAWMVERGARGLGADLSLGMLSEARKIASAPLCQMEMRRLGFASASFAAVWCDAAMLHLPKADVPGALAEIARVLLPGGFFFFSVKEGSGEGMEIFSKFNVDRYFSYYTPTELRQILEQAGFTVLRQKRSSDGKRFWLTWLWFETRLPG